MTPGTYYDSADATVGDTLWFRVRFNTTDGANPATDNLQFGNIDVVDWIPRGTEFVSGSESINYSASGDFNYGTGFPPEKFPANHFDQSPAEISSGAWTGSAGRSGR